MAPETYYVISKSSLLEALDKARWGNIDAEAMLNELEGRNEVEEIEHDEDAA